MHNDMNKRQYHLFDAQGKVLGRMATEIAKILDGRNKVDYTPNIDGGDFVVVINADKIRVTGNKLEGKIYHHFSGYPGGISSISLKNLLKKDSKKVIQNAVYGMLPKNKLRDKMMLRLYVYADAQHNHKNIGVTH
jgi:large subunit ribosomal protein L13